MILSVKLKCPQMLRLYQQTGGFCVLCFFVRPCLFVERQNGAMVFWWLWASGGPSSPPSPALVSTSGHPCTADLLVLLSSPPEKNFLHKLEFCELFVKCLKERCHEKLKLIYLIETHQICVWKPPGIPNQGKPPTFPRLLSSVPRNWE